MAAAVLDPRAIALVGAPDGDVGFKDAKHPPVQAMQVDIAQDIVDELLESASTGKLPQIIFGRTPVRCAHTHPPKPSPTHRACLLCLSPSPSSLGPGGLGATTTHDMS